MTFINRTRGSELSTVSRGAVIKAHQAIERLRSELSLTQGDVLKEMGIGMSAYQRLSKGQRPNAETLFRVKAWIRKAADRLERRKRA